MTVKHGKKKMVSPLRWIGGKSRMVKYILPMIPSHKVYVEPFGGAAWLMFAKEPSRVEVYNDLDSCLVDFFRILQDDLEFRKLEKKLKRTPYSRELFEEFRYSYIDETDRLERVYQWFVVLRQCFGAHVSGKHPTWGYGVSRPHGVGFHNVIEFLQESAERFKTIYIEHDSWDTVIERWDSEEAFFYVDPPYVTSTRQSGAYSHEMTDAGHMKLIELLKSAKAKCMLSGYNNEIYRDLKWARYDVREGITCSLAGRTKATGLIGEEHVTEKQKRVESIWINYECDVPSGVIKCEELQGVAKKQGRAEVNTFQGELF